MLNRVSGPAFQGAYKYTAPDVDIKNSNEMMARQELDQAVTVEAWLNDSEKPRISNSDAAIYLKIDDPVKAKAFEDRVNGVIANCQKTFGVEFAKKAYLQQISDAEYNNSRPMQ